MTRLLDSESDASLRIDRRTALRSVVGGLSALGLGLATGGTASAQEGFPPGERTRWGNAVTVGDGDARAFLTRGRSGAPRFLGVRLSEDALSGLPEEGDHVRQTVPLPDGAATVANVEWLTADWNPHGHLPEDVYDVPHFDFHFYLDPQERVERRIPPGECDADGDGEADRPVPCDVYERATEPLPDAQRPPGYVPTDDVIPVMGNHWVEQDAPELQGEQFTHTYIYGSFDGRINFLEPMITREFLENLRGRVGTEVPTPRRFPTRGFYPTEYAIRRVRGEDAVAVYLRRFQQFRGTQSAFRATKTVWPSSPGSAASSYQPKRSTDRSNTAQTPSR
jgi:hypothetical protein